MLACMLNVQKIKLPSNFWGVDDKIDFEIFSHTHRVVAWMVQVMLNFKIRISQIVRIWHVIWHKVKRQILFVDG